MNKPLLTHYQVSTQATQEFHGKLCDALRLLDDCNVSMKDQTYYSIKRHLTDILKIMHKDVGVRC